MLPKGIKFTDAMKRDFFENTQVAFQLKSNFELRRAYWLFRLIQNKTLVSIGKRITQIALRLRLPIDGVIKATVFNQFCSGVSAQASQKVVNRLGAVRIASVLAYSVEGTASEAGFDASLAKTLETLNDQKGNPNHPYGVFKPTAIGAFSLFEKIAQKEVLTVTEQAAWERVKNRFETLCSQSVSWGLRVFVDAEESWIQPAIDTLVEEAMSRHNKKEANVITTVQMYRHDRLEYLKGLIEKANRQDFQLGVKLVRGAYIEKENERAQKLGYPSPICASKSETDQNFDAGVQTLVAHLDRCTLFMGSHNENSILSLLELMAKNKIANNHPNIWFGQLYGMSDHLSFNLADNGYNVAKYIPFGPIKEVLPYLIRRAEENTSVAGQSSRELELITKELNRRASPADAA